MLIALWRWIDDRALNDVDKRTLAQIEAVKVASGVIVGGGGLFALYLAARRQRTQELELQVRQIELAQRDRVQVHAEKVAEDTRQDAVERRVTELYTKAADQLGSDKAPVRLAGLYALERLGQGNPGHRQTVTNVVCAYLRMPYTPPDEQADLNEPTERQQREELQVRTTAQRILADHLRDEPLADRAQPPSSPNTFWAGIDLDLTGAHLLDFALAEARLVSINLNDATLAGETVFSGTTCELAFMQHTNFKGLADFRGTEFTNSAWFTSSVFADDVRFDGDQFYRPAKFGRHVSFRASAFHRKACFEGAAFSGSADFREVNWLGGAASVELKSTVIENPETTSPEADAAASAWPDGWHLAIASNHVTLERT
ncbi:pentapeptide repeat-containing protein [Amycolatopsis halotolerans]|uniref:Pentapeptide repeat-containing protein n=1 Tax=Amycolatopsis halotolerans TaxID=330083 RepID=A0ABV7QCZ3_9PSEU